jgi:hypothetical protein
MAKLVESHQMTYSIINVYQLKRKPDKFTTRPIVFTHPREETLVVVNISIAMVIKNVG